MATDGNASFVHTIQEGIERVYASTDEHPWAFLSESASFKYAITQGRCDMEVLVDGSIPRYLSLATPIGSPLYDRLSLAILEMVEKGEVNALRTKWWYPLVDCQNSTYN